MATIFDISFVDVSCLPDINCNFVHFQFVRRSPELAESRTVEDGGARTERTSSRSPQEGGEGLVPGVRGRREREDEAGDPGSQK